MLFHEEKAQCAIFLEHTFFDGKSVQRYCFFLNWQNFCTKKCKKPLIICRYEIFFVPLYAKYARMRRALYILGVMFAGLALVGGTFVAALSSDKVETAAVQLAAKELSRALGTNAQVGSVSYQFPARLTIRDIYLEDLQGDTLAFVGEAYAQFSPLALRNKEIKFSHVRLSDVLVDAHRLQDSTWNYQFLVDAFKTEEKKEDSPMRSLIAVKDVQLDSVRLRYEDYHVFVSHADMDLHRLSAQMLDAEITELAGTVRRKSSVIGHSSPFLVEDLDAHVILTDSMLSVPTMRARLPHSKLELSEIALRLPFDSAELVAPLRIEAQLVPAEISLFVPALSTLKRPLGLSGAISGSLDSIAFREMELRYNGKPVLQGDVAAVGLPDMSNPYLRANLTDVHTNAAQLQDFLSQLNGSPVRLPKEVHRLGDIHYRGLAQGQLHDLTLHGAFRTALGVISTDGTFRSDSTFEHLAYDARVVGKNFRLGKMLDVPALQTVTLDLASKGRIDKGALYGDVKAHVRQFTYNNYTYDDLHIDGKLEPRRYQGKFTIDDPHLTLAFDGVVNLRERDPEVNFNLLCRHFDTEPLSQTRLRTSFALAVDLNGKRADDMSGYMVLDSLFLATPLDSMLMQQMTLLVSADGANGKAI
ncbi:MAG: AsmA family protein, partial [Bacteroidales bacterium]|nr:AsmA family protein [Bacteroidales bacterium]